jgi:hypothetical protein
MRFRSVFNTRRYFGVGISYAIAGHPTIEDHSMSIQEPKACQLDETTQVNGSAACQ